jgi:hypothetical protein
MARGGAFRERQVVNAPTPRARIDTRDQSREEQAQYYQAGGGAPKPRKGSAFEDAERPEPERFKATPESLKRLEMFATTRGNIMHLLTPGQCGRIAVDAIREWRLDQTSRQSWLDLAEDGLRLACQEAEDGDEGRVKDFPYEGASDLHYPILTTASLQFQARAASEIIRGDKVVGVKVFEAPSPPAQKPQQLQMGHIGGPPLDLQAAQAQQQAAQQAQQQAEAQADAADAAKNARGQRVAHYLNWLVFYQMPDWEDETDVLLLETSITGCGFKKILMSSSGLMSEYVSATRLTVNNKTKSLQKAPRITHDFDIYPYEIERGQRAGIYADVSLPLKDSSDPESARLWIEQVRFEDLDDDGMVEPYIVTVDVDQQTCMAIQSAYTAEDVVVDTEAGKVVRIDRWDQYASFRFLPDPKGRFYALGLAKLLAQITDAVDTSINQLMDAGTAEIAGGGFVGGNVRIQGSGQSGSLYFQPGEYKTLNAPGADLREAIFERTVPHPSEVTFKLLELLLAAAKDVASVKDVITGDAPSTAPVGTTMALQNQALEVYSSIYRRIYRGFRDEFRILFHFIRRFANANMRTKYKELTNGDLDQDFAGDGTDIQPVADPAVVTKMQKTSRFQTLTQIAESPVGMAAGMTQPGPAQEIIKEGLDILQFDRPERFVAQVPPNPELVAKTQELQAATKLKLAQAQHYGATGDLDVARASEADARANQFRVDALHTLGEVHEQTHRLHQEGHRVKHQGLEPPSPEGGLNAVEPISPPAEPSPPGAGGGA